MEGQKCLSPSTYIRSYSDLCKIPNCPGKSCCSLFNGRKMHNPKLGPSLKKSDSPKLSYRPNRFGDRMLGPHHPKENIEYPTCAPRKEEELYRLAVLEGTHLKHYRDAALAMHSPLPSTSLETSMI